MKEMQAEGEQRLDRFRDILRRGGVKLTHQRMVIFQEVAGMDCHPDAETVYRAVRSRLPMVSLDTVYRTLWLLQDLGLVRVLGARDRVRFDGNTRPHHHFVCRKCGAMLDFCSSEYDRVKIPQVVRALGKPETARVEILGTCVECSVKPGPTDPAKRTGKKRPKS